VIEKRIGKPGNDLPNQENQAILKCLEQKINGGRHQREEDLWNLRLIDWQLLFETNYSNILA